MNWKIVVCLLSPLVFFIHGGVWMFGDKSLFTGVDEYLSAGISVFRSTTVTPRTLYRRASRRQ